MERAVQTRVNENIAILFSFSFEWDITNNLTDDMKYPELKKNYCLMINLKKKKKKTYPQTHSIFG